MVGYTITLVVLFYYCEVSSKGTAGALFFICKRRLTNLETVMEFWGGMHYRVTN